ncbi:MAG: hypothetical protein CM1200mP40_00210 [Gammaproteobacteria bacterium]|nr:MAG: hypothetical protein CM1200mP40_00210 [Gammaproteobacteria bacterium]
MTLAIFLLQTSTAQSVQPDDLGFIIATPDDLFQGGARSETIYGDPSRPGLYAIRITFPLEQAVDPTTTARRVTSL